MNRQVSIRIIRTVSEIEEIRGIWGALHRHPNSDIDLYLLCLRSRPQVVRPHVMVAYRDGSPDALLIGRIETKPVDFRVGYKSFYRPSVRGLAFIYQGFLGNESPECAELLVSEIMRSLCTGEADLVFFNSLRGDSLVCRFAQRLPSILSRDFFSDVHLHWKTRIPDSYSDFIASLSSNTRHNLRRYSHRLLKAFGEDLLVRRFCRTSELDQILEDTETVASKTYHRGMGVGFVNNEETRQLTKLALEKQWFRAHILYVKGRPCAFWNGLRYGRTFYTGTTGADPLYQEYRVGTFLLTKVLEDLCRDGEVEEVDFGLGDAQYKRDVCNQSWQEVSLYLFAPTLKGFQLNVLRTPPMMVSKAARAVLSLGLQTRIKKLWRRRHMRQ